MSHVRSMTLDLTDEKRTLPSWFSSPKPRRPGNRERNVTQTPRRSVCTLPARPSAPSRSPRTGAGRGSHGLRGLRRPRPSVGPVRLWCRKGAKVKTTENQVRVRLVARRPCCPGAVTCSVVQGGLGARLYGTPCTVFATFPET